MKKIMIIIVIAFISSLSIFTNNTFALKFYRFAPGEWTHTGPDYLFGDKCLKTIESYRDINGNIDYVTSYSVSCWGDVNVLCFLREDGGISVNMTLPSPSSGDTYNGLSAGDINDE